MSTPQTTQPPWPVEAAVDPAGEALGVGPVVPLAGRFAERARVDGFLRAVASGAGGLEIRGEAGIGKTSLWRHGVDAARRTGHVVLVARASREEMADARGGLRDLFDGTDLLPALIDPDADHFELGRRVLTWLRARADERPVLLAVDDLQWIDPGSLRALRYAVRRLDRERVGLLVTIRSDAETAAATATGMLAAGACDRVDLGPVDLTTMRSVLAGAVQTIPRRLLRRIHLVSGGNPLYAIELARGLTHGDGAPERDLSLPASLQAAIEQRLSLVPDEIHPLLDVVAVAGPIGVDDLVELASASDLAERLGAAERLGMLSVEDDLRIRFTHPLLASAVYARMSPLTRRRLHARLAATERRTQQRARHLALSTSAPDAEIAASLEAAAREACTAGAADRAAALAAHSLRLSPAADAADRHRRALLEVATLAAAGDTRAARERIDDLLAVLPHGETRVAALVERFYVSGDDYTTGDAALTEALRAGGSEATRAKVLDLLGWLRGMFLGDLASGIACADEAVALAAHEPGALLAMATARRTHMARLAGSAGPAAMDAAVQLEADLGSSTHGGGARAWRAKQLLWDGELEAARHEIEALLDDESIANRDLERPYRLYDLALVTCAGGDLAATRKHVTEGLQSAADADNTDAAGWLLYPAALEAAWRGDVAAVERTVARLQHGDGRPGGRPGEARARYVLGLLALSHNDAERAASELTRSADLLERWGVGHPGAVPTLPAAVEALAAAGDHDAAARMRDRLADQVDHVSTPWTRNLLALADGAILATTSQLDDAVDVLDAAAAGLHDLGHHLDAARAVLASGRAMLRSGRRTASAERLNDARQRFHDLGAATWAQRAEEALERAAPGRASGRLTRTERRIAALVTEGRKNREIAQAAFMSVATVEAHLTRIYRKLGIRSRTDLARLVMDGELAGVDVE